MDSKNTNSKYTTLSQRIAYKAPWVQVREDEIIHPNGNKGLYSVMELPEFAAIIAITSEGKIPLVRQWRYPIKADSWELPMGRCDGDETALTAAKRELYEETGMQSSDWHKIGYFQPAVGVLNAPGNLFVAKNAVAINAELDTEVNSTALFTPDQLLKMIQDDKIFDSETLGCLMLAQAKGFI